MLLKFVLRQRCLNETFTGGVGSYLLLNMTYAYVQYLMKRGEVDKINNLGKLFIGFLKFYGEEFNYKELGISINDGGEFFKKWQRNFVNANNNGGDFLCFENYQEPDMDLARGAYQYPKVTQLFREILYTLYKVKSNSESYLTSFINITSEMRMINNTMKQNKENKENRHNKIKIYHNI